MHSFVLLYTKKQKKVFFDNFNEAVEDLKEDPVHDLRVSVKRLKTVTRMLNYNKNAEFDFKKNLEPITILYKNLGSIRDFQVLCNLTKDYQKTTGIHLSNLIDYLNKQIDKSIENFSKKKDKIDQSLLLESFNNIENYVLPLKSEYIKNTIIQYRENLGQKYLKYTNKRNKKYDLHKARKMVKNISYLMEMAGAEIGGFADSFKHYKNLGSKLGKWHDLDIYYYQLKSDTLAKRISNKNMKQLLKYVEHERKKAEDELSHSI